VLGRIRRGFQADLVSVTCSGGPNFIEEIVAFDGPVDWMLLNGKQRRNTPGAAKLSR
jgi:hypothetical protein